MLKRHVCTARQHPASHEFVGGVCLLPPDDVRKVDKPDGKASIYNSRMVVEELKLLIDGAGGIPDVYTHKTSIFEEAVAFTPHLIELLVHKLKSQLWFGSQGLLDRRVLCGHNVVPHLYHRVWRGSNNQIDTFTL